MRSRTALVAALAALAALPAAASAAAPECPPSAAVPAQRLAPVIASPAPSASVLRGAMLSVRVGLPASLQELGYSAAPLAVETTISRGGAVVGRWGGDAPAALDERVQLRTVGRYQITSIVTWDLSELPASDPSAAAGVCSVVSSSAFRVWRRTVAPQVLMAKLRRGMNRAAGGVRRGSLSVTATYLTRLAMEVDGLRLRDAAATRALDRWIPTAYTFAAVMADIDGRQPNITQADATRLDRAAARFQKASVRLGAALARVAS
ncbi:MAG: hypothetical protein AB7V42_12650 [Thermoleophilia bacterium]